MTKVYVDKVPVDCVECPVYNGDRGICNLLEDYTEFEYGERPTNCPLEEVKHEECVYIITKGKAGYNEEYKCSACGDSFYWTQDRFIPRRFNYCRNCGAKVVGFVEDMSGKETGHEGERK